VKVFPESSRVPGAILEHAGRLYRLDRVEPHRCRDGHIVDFGVWRTSCAECGQPIEIRAPITQVPKVRRCPAHRAPGRPVLHRPLRTTFQPPVAFLQREGAE